MNNRTSVFACVLGALLCALTACATSPQHYTAADRFAADGDYTGALEFITGEKENAYQAKDRVLYYLDTGLLAHYAGDLDRSKRELENAERAIEECFTKSISQSVSSFVVNDNTKDYTGEDYEDIYINIFNALNYCRQDNHDGAFVEIRKVNLKLRTLLLKYDELFAETENTFRRESPSGAYRRQPVNFSTSALAHYISMLLYRSEAKTDDVRIDRQAIAKAFKTQPELYPFDEPSTIAAETQIPRGKARLNLICFSGTAPVKEELVERFDNPYTGTYYKLAIPVLMPRPSHVDRIAVAIDGGETYPVELLEDMEAAAFESFKAKSDLIYNRAIIRSLTKTVATTAATAISRETNNDNLSLLLSIGSKIFIEASEQADTRCSRYFPAKASVTGITLDPGIYSFTVYYYTKNGHCLKAERFENIEVNENQLNLQESICLY